MQSNLFLRKLLLPFSAALAFSAPALQAGIEDRENEAQTGRLWAYNVTVDQYKAIIAQGNRCVDFEIVRTSPSTLVTMAYVPNSGSFQKGWWWGIGLTSAGVVNMINTHKARLTDIECYEIGGQLRFAVLMEANSVNGKGWWWKFNSNPSAILADAQQFGARIVDIERYTIGATTYYAAILLKNSGGDAKAWWYSFGASWNSISTTLSTNGAKLWDLDYLGNGLYNAIMVKWTSGSQWRLFGLDKTQVAEYMNQYGARIIDIEQYGSLSDPRFNILLINASGPITARIRGEMQSRSNGWTGFYAERLDPNGNGSVLTYLNRSREFEPASTLKTLHHVHAMRQVALNQIGLNSSVTVNTATTANNSCPQPTTPYSRTLQQVLTGMMEQSNNSFTRAITDRFGMNVLNTTATQLGMVDTKVNHHIGCGTPANTVTLDDLARLHERVVQGYLGPQRANFYAMMTNSFNVPAQGYARGYFNAVIAEEAAKVGLSAQQTSDFIAAMYVAGKSGSYTIGNKEHRAYFGMVRLPFWQNGGLVEVEYACGAFVNDANDGTKARDAAATGATEVLREEIHKAMQSLKSYTFGHFTPYGSSCSGPLSPWVHTATGTPELGQDAFFQATANRTGRTQVMLFLGSSNKFWNRAPLPMSLSFMGASGCDFLTNALIAIPAYALDGKVSLKASIPVDKSLLGLEVHTQFLIAEAAANYAGLSVTNGLTTLVGGQK